MLKLYFFVLCLLALSLAQEKIKGRYENLNIDMILSNNRILDSYIKCLLDKGPCTVEGREFKADIPKAIVTGCAQCTDAQKKLVKKATSFVMKNRPQDWEAITKHYDPQQKYIKTFTEFLETN